MAPANAGLHRTIPALPVGDVAAAAADYRERLGFAVDVLEPGFAILSRDAAVLHLWEAADEAWREPGALGDRPVRSGAESFLAGTASCRIEVRDVDALHAELAPRGVLHPATPHVAATDFGTREFAAGDRDGNLLTFFSLAGDAPPDLPAEVWLPGPLRVEIRLTAADTGGAFCLLADHPPPGWSLPPHRHAHEAETIRVVAGRFDSIVDGVRSELGPGDVAHIPRGVTHSGAVLGDEPGERVLIFSPAGMEGFFAAADGVTGPGELARLAAEFGWRF